MNTSHEKCPRCGSDMVKRNGKFGDFLACSAYPKCNYTVTASPQQELDVVEGKSCPVCGGAVIARDGEHGRFFGCGNFPVCKWSASSLAPKAKELDCPQCSVGVLKKRLSKSEKEFWSCSNYPNCDYTLPKQPLDKPCPHCAWQVTMEKTTVRKGREQVCPKCKNTFPLKDDK